MIVKIGLDLASVDRFVFSPERAAWYALRIFTETEARYATQKRYPQQHFAGAFAAKEAFRKALGRSVPWRDVGVTHDSDGTPRLHLGPTAQAALAELGNIHVHLSISHTTRDAAATVILERRT